MAFGAPGPPSTDLSRRRAASLSALAASQLGPALGTGTQCGLEGARKQK